MNLLEPGRFVWPVLGIERYQAVAIPESVHTVVIYSQHGAEAARAIERATPHLAANGRQLVVRSEEHTSELQSLMRTSYAVFCLKKININQSTKIWIDTQSSRYHRYMINCASDTLD